ncbi:hypothetical protein SDC9_171913 [bioreactor metagenome]|uniref:Uncharacterized protein n=1 Tax=bioreactor metagenome TaxID=1076179 RepID=A0A645GKP9_9ZZZZ
MLRLMPADEPLQRVDGLLLLSLSMGWVDHGGVQHLARSVHHGDLAPVSIAGVKPHGDPAPDRRLH